MCEFQVNCIELDLEIGVKKRRLLKGRVRIIYRADDDRGRRNDRDRR